MQSIGLSFLTWNHRSPKNYDDKVSHKYYMHGKNSQNPVALVMLDQEELHKVHMSICISLISRNPSILHVLILPALI